MAKLVDAGDSKSPAARCVGSSPTLGTMENKPRFAVIFLPVVWAHLTPSLRITVHSLDYKPRKNQLLPFCLITRTNTFSICISWHTCHHTRNKPIQSTINHILLQILFLIASQAPYPTLLHPLSSLRLSHCFYSPRSNITHLFWYFCKNSLTLNIYAL